MSGCPGQWENIGCGPQSRTALWLTGTFLLGAGIHRGHELGCCRWGCDADQAAANPVWRHSDLEHVWWRAASPRFEAADTNSKAAGSNSRGTPAGASWRRTGGTSRSRRRPRGGGEAGPSTSATQLRKPAVQQPGRGQRGGTAGSQVWWLPGCAVLQRRMLPGRLAGAQAGLQAAATGPGQRRLMRGVD